MSDESQATEPGSATGRGLFWAGLALALAGIPLFIVQSLLKRQFVPWYVPILATLGVVLMGLSLRGRRSIARYIALGLIVAFCGFGWFALGVMIRLPEYTGPAVAMKKLPPFTTALADGRPFTQADLEMGRPTVLTFYRGHW